MKNMNKNLRKRGNELLRKLLTLVVLLLTIQIVTAQSASIKGVVKDESGAILPGVSVKVQGTKIGTITDINGNFRISGVTQKSILEFSFIGLETQRITVGTQQSLVVTLKNSAFTLNEVVSIGYGSVKKSSLTGAVSKVKAEALADRPITRVETALQGAMPGVDVRTTTGQPGQDVQIRIRGAASISASSDPLYVVDGVPVSSLSNINPADISTMEVLKDAASAAIYGSRGSNGVVLVTTKSGKSNKNESPTISFTATYGTQMLEKKLDLLSATEWINFRLRYNDANYLKLAANNKVTNASISDDNTTRMKNIGGDITKAKNYNVILDDRWFNIVAPGQHSYTPTSDQLSLLDWQDNFFQSAPTQQYNLNVNGGTEKTKYMFSAGYINQEGIARGTGYNRLSVRLNIESKIKSWLTAGMIMAPSYSTTTGGGLANGKDSKTHQTVASTPVSESGVGYMTNVQPNTQYLWAGTTSSTSYYMDKNLNSSKTMFLNATSFVRLEPFKGLKVQATAATNFSNTNGSTYIYSATSSSWSSGEGISSSGSHTTSTKFDNSLFQVIANYDNSFGNHNIGAMAGYSVEQSNTGYSTNQTYSKPFNDALAESFNGSVIAAGTNIVTQLTPNDLLSYFGRLQYDYSGKYFVSASIRRDGCSLFGLKNQWGSFPAASAAWKISDEPFFKSLNINQLNNVKLRASFGITGNNSIPYTASQALVTATNYGGTAISGGQAGYYISSSGNPLLGWEKANSTDLAIDLGAFNNRVQLSLDYYTKKTFDLLYEVPVLGASGFTKQWDNIGDIDNKGLEVELNTKNLTGKLKWSTSFNVAYNKNVVKRIGINNTPVLSGFDATNTSNILEVGRPINTFYMYEAVGVWKTQAEIDAYSAAHNGTAVTFNGTKFVPGDIRYKDTNDDGVITTADKTYLGSPTPKFTYGLTNTFEYKNFDLSFLITAQSGGKIYGILGRAIDRPGMGASSNAMGRWRNAWWSETEQGDGSTPYILSTTTGTTLDSRWLYSSDYIRIKNLTFGYKLPVLPKYYSSARVFVSCENLAIFDSYYGGFSPEAANSGSSTAVGGGNSLGIDYGGYPTSRVFTMGVNIVF